jgi:2-methylaconitate cis-trans-isomerase PrpF
MNEMIRIPTVIYRGGTSKAIFLKENDLPPDVKQRDKTICAIFGSPDKRQIDGLGGADPLTSKVALIGPASRADADIDYTFGQVDINSSGIFYGAVCGNVSAAVGPFAIDEGYVRPQEPQTVVRIHCTNNGRILEATVPVVGDGVKVDGDFSIDGVPGTGAKIELNWSDLVGANTGHLLPTGNVQDTLDVEGVGQIKVSLVDVANPGVFVNASDVGLTGAESPDEIDANAELLKKSEAINQAAMKKINKFTLLTYVAPSRDYTNFLTGQTVKGDQVDFLVRMIFGKITHKTFAGSMTNCCGTAAMIPGTVVNLVARPDLKTRSRVRMGHPSGWADLEGIDIRESETGIEVKKIIVCRTARRLMEGYAFVKREVL